MTLWTMEFQLDQADSPLLEGFSVPSALSDLVLSPLAATTHEIPPAALGQPGEHGLLRPPITVA
jgi:hypothetical protein